MYDLRLTQDPSPIFFRLYFTRIATIHIIVHKLQSVRLKREMVGHKRADARFLSGFIIPLVAINYSTLSPILLFVFSGFVNKDLIYVY